MFLKFNIMLVNTILVTLAVGMSFAKVAHLNRGTGKMSSKDHGATLEGTPKSSDQVNELSLLLDSVRHYELKTRLQQSNYSYQQDLARLAAEAEIQEAQKRKQEAWRDSVRAEHVFDADRARYNLGYIGRGYDLLKGHPNSPQGVVDPGFRLPVLRLTYSSAHTADGYYRVPDDVDVVSEPSAKFSSSSSIITSSRDYQAKLQQSVKVSAEFSYSGLFSAQASFSLDHSFKSDSREMTKSNKAYLDIEGRAVVYRARLTKPTNSKLSREFEAALKSVVGGSCEGPDGQRRVDYYMPLIDQFGTHYTTEVTMGAKATQRRVMEKESASSLKHAAQSLGVSVSGGGGGWGVSAKAGVDYNRKSEEKLKQKLEEQSTEVREFYIGGSAPEGKFDDGDTESLRNWARSAQENPAPIDYKLRYLHEAIQSDAVFNEPIQDVVERRKCLQLALMRHCLDNVADPRLCQTSGRHASTDRGHRRDKRSIQHRRPDAPKIKYGDFVQFSWSSTSSEDSPDWLMLGPETPLLGGAPSGFPFRTHDSVKNHSHLFQILPPHGEDSSLGDQNLTYGARFRLNTITGEDIVLTKMLDVTAAKNDITSSRQVSEKAMGKKSVAALTWGKVTLNQYFFRFENAQPYRFSITLQGTNGQKTFVFHSKSNFTETLSAKDLGDLSTEVKCENCRAVFSMEIYDIRHGRQYRADNVKNGLTVLHLKSSYYQIMKRLYSFECEFTFAKANSDITENDVYSDEPGIIQVISDAPKSHQYWGNDAPHVLVADPSTREVTVVSTLLRPDPGAHGEEICETQATVHTKHAGEEWTTYTFSDEIYFLKPLQITWGQDVTLRDFSFVVQYKEGADMLWHNMTTWKIGENVTEAEPIMTHSRIKKVRISIPNGIDKTKIAYAAVFYGCTLSQSYRETSDRYLNGNMLWRIHKSDKEVRTSPTVHVVKQKEVNLKVTETIFTRNLFQEITIRKSNMRCMLSEGHVRASLMQLLGASKSFLRNFTTIQQTQPEEGVYVITLNYTVFADSDVTLNDAVTKLQQLPDRHDVLPCLEMAPPPVFHRRVHYRSDSRWHWIIALSFICAILVIVILAMAYTYYRNYQRLSHKLTCHRCPDRGDHGSTEYLAPHDYVNAYVGLHRMMSTFAHMSNQQYDSPYFHMPRNEDQGPFADNIHRNKRPTSAPCGEHLDQETYETFRAFSRMNSRCTERARPTSHACDGVFINPKNDECPLPAHVRRRHHSKTSHSNFKDNFRRFTRCLSAEEEENPQNEVKLNNRDSDQSVFDIGLPKQQNPKLEANGTKVNLKGIIREHGELLKSAVHNKHTSRETSVQGFNSSFADSLIQRLESKESNVENMGQATGLPEDSQVSANPSHHAEPEAVIDASQKEPATPDPVYSRAEPGKGLFKKHASPKTDWQGKGDKPAFHPKPQMKPGKRRPPPLPAYSEARKDAMMERGMDPSATEQQDVLIAPSTPAHVHARFLDHQQPGSSTAGIPVMVCIDNGELASRLARVATESSDHNRSSSSSGETTGTRESTESSV